MENTLRRVYSSRKISLFLKLVSNATVIISVLSYAALLFLSFRNNIYKGLAVFFSLAFPGICAIM